MKRILITLGLALAAAVQAGEAPRPSWFCQLRGKLIYDRDYFFARGQDAWYGPADLNCQESPTGAVRSLRLLVGFQAQIPSSGQWVMDLINVESDTIILSEPSDFISTMTSTTATQKSSLRGLEIALQIRLEEAYWQLRLILPPNWRPYSDGFLSPGLFWVEPAVPRRRWL